MRLALVIPTLDESRALAATLRWATSARDAGEVDHIVISDGGSRDGTVALAREAGVTVVEGAPGRGIQLNRGAQAADGEALMFLHADTRLPDGAGNAVRRALAEGAVGGGFTVRFDEPTRLFGLGSRIVNLRTRLTGCPLGDQAQFVRRDAFERLEGFRPWPILEDLDFARRLKRLGRTALIEGPAVTAARRYTQQGITRTIVLNWLIWALYFVGVSPERLARLYRHRR